MKELKKEKKNPRWIVVLRTRYSPCLSSVLYANHIGQTGIYLGKFATLSLLDVLFPNVMRVHFVLPDNFFFHALFYKCVYTLLFITQ